MRVFIAVLVLIFSLQSWTKADDIFDFEIEGISIGDSLLDLIKKETILDHIKENTKYYKKKIPKNKFGEVYLFRTINSYDKMSFFVKTDDPKYKIYMVRGMINFNNNLNECLKKKNEIVKDIESLFTDIEKRDSKFKSDLDSTGKSYYYQAAFDFSSGDTISITCTDWEEKLRKKNNWTEGVSVVIQESDFVDWITSD